MIAIIKQYNTISFTKQDLLNSIADFTYFWGADFFVETSFGNFHWKDPDYNGDNSFTLINKDYGQFCNSMNVEFGRSKGFHVVERYCGPDINIIAPKRLKPT